MFSYNREIEHTEFYSGCLYFLAEQDVFKMEVFPQDHTSLDEISINDIQQESYLIYTEDGTLLNER